VQQVPACFHLAGAPEVDRIHAEAVERIGTVQHSISRQDGAELGGEGVERPLELIGDDDQRHRQVRAPPGRHTPRAALEVAEAELAHHDERVRGGARRHGPMACRPYSTTADSRRAKMVRRSATSASSAEPIWSFYVRDAIRCHE
jgi:hypothetical protein